MSKGYTINYFSTVIKTFTTGKLTSLGVVGAVAPIGGVTSIKVQALNSWLGGNLLAIESGKGRFAGFGKTSKTRLLKALNLRYKNGTV